MPKIYKKVIAECGENCPSFAEDSFYYGIHGCYLCPDERVTAEMFHEITKSGKNFPDWCPLQDEKETE